MSNCGCNHGHDHGAGVVPGPCMVPPKCENDNTRLKTVTLPATVGTDEEGQPFAPKLGAYYNSVVVYQANGAVYIYDARGIYQKIGYTTVVTSWNGMVGDVEFPQGTVDEQEEGWVSGNDVYTAVNNAKQTVENELFETERQLTENINGVKNDLDSAKQELEESIDETKTDLENQIEDIKNSPDVRYIVDTHADLAGLEGVGDKDYARVLQDETHDGASTYYQYDLASTTWNYVGMTGPYYTKQEIDEMIGEAVTRLEAI